jgi:predicted acetylornithine/succinylornithine family transaminase
MAVDQLRYPVGYAACTARRRMSSALLQNAVMPTYARQEITFVEGDGCELVDAAGKRYLDFGAGIAVVSLGHRHPAPLAAAHAQLDRLWHTSNLYWTEPQIALAERLSARIGGGQTFFCNSGTEANEAAIKYARKATGKPGIVALEGSFHGRSTGALAATGQPSKRAAFEPLLPGVRFARPNDVDSLHAAFGDDVGLILLEPVLGEGGVIPLEPAFLEAARALDAVLCFDEIQTGIGRTGSFFAFEQLGVRPDILTLAKALANGLPIGALVVSGESAFGPGDHGSTFGGNPVSCAAACAVVDAIDEELLANVAAQGAKIRTALAGFAGVRSVRGAGLLIGAELDAPAGDVIKRCLDAGLVVLSAGAHVLRLAPPLVVGDAEVDRALSILEEVLS